MKLTARNWLRSAGRVAVCAVTIWLAGLAAAHAQAVSTTTVQGTAYLANGQPAGGTLVVSWPTFTTAAGQLISAGQTTVTVGTDGYVSVDLAPNQGATPAGEYYTAVFYKSDGTVSREYWTIPAAAQASLAQVQAQVMPAAQAVQAVSKAYVDQAVSQALGSQLSGSGGDLTGPLYLNSDPTQPMQAADKHYVDSSFSAALPLSGGTMTGPANFGAAVTFGSNVTASSGIGFTGTGAAQTLANLLPGAASDSANGMTLTGQSVPNAIVPKVSPQADIRANGAKIDGATDISAALNASIAQCNGSNGDSCTVLLPCAGPNGCYLANGSGIVWSAPLNGQVLHIKLQGTLIVGSTLVTPSYISLTCDGGGRSGQFQFAGPTCNINGKNQVQGTLGTPITTTGSPVTFTPTYSSGSASNFNANSAITVAGLQTCSATASRTLAGSGPNTVFTLTGCTDSSGDAEASPATPVQSTVTVTGCADSGFDITGGVVNAQDWPNDQESIFESGSTATTTGCTVTGFDNSTFETLRISAVSSGTMTATFVHKHAASDVYGMVTVAPTKSSFHADFESVVIDSMGGAAMWLEDVNAINLSQSTFGTSIGSGLTEFPLECDGCWQGGWDKDQFIVRGPTPFGCVSNCVSSYPWGIRFTQEAAASNIGIGGAFIGITNSTITGGIKVDGNGIAAINGVGPEIGPLDGNVFEQTVAGAITVDPSTYLGGPVSISMNYDFLQDNILHNTQYYLYGTSCCVQGFANLGDIPSFNSTGGSQGNLANPYWPNHVMANNVNMMLNPGSVGNSTGLLTSGDTILGNFEGENAGLAPNIVPQSTLAVTLNPTCGTCVAITGPDGVANSAVEVQKSGTTKVFEQVGSTSIGTYAGDTIIFGSYCKPGTGTNVWSGLLLVQTSGTDRFLANTFFPTTGTGTQVTANGPVPLTNGTWQKCFAVGQIVTGESTAHTIVFDLESPNSGNSTGNDFYDPFWLYVPGPNNPSCLSVACPTQAEAVRWAEEMFKGYVPSGARTGNLYYNPAFAITSGTNTIIPANANLQYVGNVASGTTALSTTAVSSGTCNVTTTAAAGVLTTDTIIYTPSVDPTGVTGFGPSTSGSLYIWAYPTAGDVNFKVCNNTSSNITPGSLTLNWKVTR